MQQAKYTAKPDIERVGAGGEIGKGQSGVPLHKPHGVRDRELGERERVGAGGPIGQLGESHEADREAAISDATHEVVEAEIEAGDVAPATEPDQKDEV
jgi:hypothetical protein